MDRAGVERWVADYERVWRSPGTDGLAELFVPNATYLPSPWEPAQEGLAAIAAFWEDRREGPDEEFTISSEIVAVDGQTAVVRVFVEYLAPGGLAWRDLWVLRFADDGRCSAFEEWAFAPRQSDGQSGSST